VTRGTSVTGPMPAAAAIGPSPQAPVSSQSPDVTTRNGRLHPQNESNSPHVCSARGARSPRRWCAIWYGSKSPPASTAVRDRNSQTVAHVARIILVARLTRRYDDVRCRHSENSPSALSWNLPSLKCSAICWSSSVFQRCPGSINTSPSLDGYISFVKKR